MPDPRKADSPQEQDKLEERQQMPGRPLHPSDILPNLIRTRHIRFDQGVPIVERSSNPPSPPEGQSVIWQSDGTGDGDDGDIMISITAGGTTKTATLVDYSGI